MNYPNDRRSPLRALPLRQPGQSLDEQITRLVDEDLVAYVVVAAFLIAIAVIEWVRWYTTVPPNPWLFSALALTGVAIATWKIARMRRKLRQLRLGRDGERAVGQSLEELREQGFGVFHDIPGEGFNVDHVLVGTKGVFLVETKTISKPRRRDPRVVFDGEHVVVGGFKPDRDPIAQARALAVWLRRTVLDTARGKVLVRAVVVYPGWFVEGPHASPAGDVWVLNPKGLPAFMQHERDILTPEDVALIKAEISAFVRARITLGDRPLKAKQD